MDIGSEEGWPESALSNFTPHSFTFRGFAVASMEGLLQSLKEACPEKQQQIMTLVGRAAKFQGKKRKWWKTQTLFWQGKPIGRQSAEFQELLDEAFLAMFSQCQPARLALLATGSEVLEHSSGKSDPRQTVLTSAEFTSRLTCIRQQLQA